MKLTQKTIDALVLPKGKTEVIFFDDDVPGFGLRMRATGASRWVFQYKIGGRHRRVTLGNLSALTAARARETAAELHAKVRLGQDPAGAKAEGRRAVAETMIAALQAYLAEKRPAMRPGSYRGIERHLLKHCKPSHNMALSAIDRRGVAARLTAIASKSGPIEANRVRASLSAFFVWCMQQGLLDANPIIGTGRRPEQSRSRVLSFAELKAIWNATAGTDDYSAIVRLLLLTGQRAAEIGELRWSEVFDDRIVLPAERTKNAREHTIPLSPTARAILDARLRQPGRDFVFGRISDRAFTGWSACKILLNTRLREAGATFDWVTHDLRRSFATHMAELDVPPHVIEAILNHVSGHKHGVAGTYNRATYEPQKRLALNTWADHVVGVIEGRKAKSKVVPLRGA